MNPETGTFHKIEDEALAAAQQIASGEIGKDWPVFTLDETIDIKGYQFTILRIKYGDSARPHQGARKAKQADAGNDMKFAAKLFLVSFLASMWITALGWHSLVPLSVMSLLLAILCGAYLTSERNDPD